MLQRAAGIAVGLGLQGLRQHQLDTLVRNVFAVGLERARQQVVTERGLAGAVRGHGQGLEVRREGAASVLVDRGLAHPSHVGRRLGRAAQIGQADHAVDEQGAHQARVVQALAACDALVDVAQRFFVVAELQQLVRQIAVQHGVEAVATGRVHLAQRLVHVGERALGVARHRIAARDGIEQQAALLVLEHAQALVAQGQHRRERLAEAAAAPQGTGHARSGEDVTGTVADGVEAGLGVVERGDGLARRGEVQQVKAPRERGPGPGLSMIGLLGQCRRLIGQSDGIRRVHMQQLPGALRQTQRFGIGGLNGAARHAQDYPCPPRPDAGSAPGDCHACAARALPGLHSISAWIQSDDCAVGSATRCG